MEFTPPGNVLPEAAVGDLVEPWKRGRPKEALEVRLACSRIQIVSFARPRVCPGGVIRSGATIPLFRPISRPFERRLLADPCGSLRRLADPCAPSRIDWVGGATLGARTNYGIFPNQDGVTESRRPEENAKRERDRERGGEKDRTNRRGAKTYLRILEISNITIPGRFSQRGKKRPARCRLEA